MAAQALKEAAGRIGRVYAALVAANQTPLGGWAFPKWLEPARLRPFGGFHLTSKVDVGLSPVYSDGKSRRDSDLWRQHEAYGADLRVLVDHLGPALAEVVKTSLSRQVAEFHRLRLRVNQPGLADRLHESAVRIHRASGGLNPTREDLQEIDSTRGSSLFTSGSMREQFEFNTGRSSVTRRRVLQALKAERDALEADTGDPLDPREERARSEATEISALLAVIAVHFDAVTLLRLYAESPLKGSERLNEEILSAAVATDALRDRLIAEPDDAWAFAPLVVTAVVQLRLQNVPGLPEFAVAMGRILSKTKTDILIDAASLLVVGLTLAFTGPVGLVVVGTLDLALAGTDVAILMYRAHEQDIAATASDFTAEEQRLAEHARGENLILGVAGAFLSAIALVGPAKQLLKTKPRAPEVLKQEARFGEKSLPLDRRDRGETFFPRAGDETRQARSLGDPNVISASEMAQRSSATGKTSRVGGLTKGQLESRARTPRGTESNPNFGLEERTPVYDLDPGPAPDSPPPNAAYDYQDYNAIPPSQLETPPPVQPTKSRFSSARELTAADLERALPPPDLEVLFRRERVSTREQVMGLFEREGNPDWFRDLRERFGKDGTPDPLVPELIFSKANPPEVDHIVAENLIRKFDGFADLSLERQERVLHMKENLLVVTQKTNRGRLDKPFSLWEGPDGIMLAPDVRAAMAAKERALAIEIQEMINALLAQQRKVQGTVRTATGASGIGLRLTGDAARGLQPASARDEQPSR